MKKRENTERRPIAETGNSEIEKLKRNRKVIISGLITALTVVAAALGTGIVLAKVARPEPPTKFCVEENPRRKRRYPNNEKYPQEDRLN